MVETRRSHTLGRVSGKGQHSPTPVNLKGIHAACLRATADGIFTARKKIGEHCEINTVIGEIQLENRKSEIVNPLAGVLRGIIRDGVYVSKGLKIGDVDPRMT